MTSTVVFRLCAPTQSWGAPGNAADLRPTSTHPLQSSITGLIGAAMGIARNDNTSIAAISAAHMAFRIDRHGTVTSDYQTISNTIDTTGAARGTILSQRGELQDACIVAFVEWEDDHLARAVRLALRLPRWPLHLGRRCHLIGALPRTLAVEQPIDDALIGSWPHCPVHPPRNEEWTVVKDTTQPLNAPGVTLTGARASNFTDRNHLLAPIRSKRIPLLEQRATDQPDTTITVNADYTVVETS